MSNLTCESYINKVRHLILLYTRTRIYSLSLPPSLSMSPRPLSLTLLPLTSWVHNCVKFQNDTLNSFPYTILNCPLTLVPYKRKYYPLLSFSHTNNLTGSCHVFIFINISSLFPLNDLDFRFHPISCTLDHVFLPKSLLISFK